MQISRTSRQNMAVADSWDAWPLEPGPGFHLVVFRDGFSAVIHGAGNMAPVIFSTEEDAAAYMATNAPDVPRRNIPTL